MNSAETFRDNIISMLNEKYNENFALLGMGNCVLCNGGVRVTAFCYPEDCKDILFHLFYYDNGEKSIIDSYEHFLCAYDIKKILDRKLSAVSNDFFVAVNVTGDSDGYINCRDVNVYAEENKVEFYTAVVINTDEDCKIEPDDLFPTISNLFKDIPSAKGVLRFYLAEEPTVESLRDKLNSCPVIDDDMLDICEDGVGFECKIQNGTLTISKEEFISSLY